jgi:hypothetical protein
MSTNPNASKICLDFWSVPFARIVMKMNGTFYLAAQKHNLDPIFQSTQREDKMITYINYEYLP